MIVPAKDNGAFISGLLKVRGKAEPVKSLSFSKFGRDALVFALKDFKLTSEDKIAVPAYICSSALELAEAHGYKFHYFDISNNLNVTLEQIQDLISQKTIKALLLVHYFGKIQPHRRQIKAACRLNGKILIEDHCHSALSYLNMPDNRSSSTEISILSFRKCIRISDGGGATNRPNSNALNHIRLTERLHTIDNLPNLASFIEKIFYKISWPNPYSKSVTRIRTFFANLTKAKQTEALEILKPESMGPPAAVLPLLIYPAIRSAISSKRKQNYMSLSKIFMKQNFKLAQKIEKEQDTPQVLPVVDNTRTLVHFLRKKGVGAYTWPGDELPQEVIEKKELFPIAMELASSIVCLPVHQDITDKHIRRMEYLLEIWQRN